MSSCVLHLLANPDSAFTGARSIRIATADKLANIVASNSARRLGAKTGNDSVYSTELGNDVRRGAVTRKMLSSPR